MSSILKVDQLQDSGGNAIITSDGAGNITPASAFATTNGITMADQWRLSANLTAPSGTISSNLERVDDASFGYIGTGMTESSGIFSFPSTGLYLITCKGEAQNTTTKDNTFIYIKSTIDNSTYTLIGRAADSTGDTVTSSFSNMVNSVFINVTDISNVKVLFEAASFSAGSVLNGSTTDNRTVFTFIRLGDSI